MEHGQTPGRGATGAGPRGPRGRGGRAPWRLTRLIALAVLAACAVAGPVRAAELARLPVGATVHYAGNGLRGYRRLPAPVAAVGRTLLLCDSPESVARPGLLYRAHVQGPFRVFLYALDGGSAPLRFTVVVSNPSHAPVSVDVTRAGVGGPSSRYFGVATVAQAHYFDSGQPRMLTVPPGGRVFLDPGLGHRVAHPGQLINAIIDASAVAPVWVSVVAERHPHTDLHGMPLLPPGQGRLMRGTFPNADFDVDATKPAGQSYILVGENPGYLHGYSWVDQRATVDYGNYGVLYDILIHAARALKAPPGLLSVLFTGRGASYAGLALLSEGRAGRPVVLAPPSYGGVALSPGEAVVLAHAALAPGQTAFVHLQWMPAGASTLPAAFLLAG